MGKLEKNKYVFYGMVLVLCINYITTFFIDISYFLSCLLNLRIEYSIVIVTFIYLLSLYVVLKKRTHFPSIKWWFFLGAFLLVFLSPNFLFAAYLDIDVLKQIGLLGDELLPLRTIYGLAFSILTYIRFRMLSKSEDRTKQDISLIFYGIVIFDILSHILPLISLLTYKGALILSIPIVFCVGVLILIFVATYVIWMQLVGKKHLSWWIWGAAILIRYIRPLIDKITINTSYNPSDQGLVFSILLSGPGQILLILGIISYVNYWEIEKGRRPDFTRNNKNNRLKIVYTTLLSLGSVLLALGYNTIYNKLASYNDYKQVLKEMPDELVSHFPQTINGLLEYSINYPHSSSEKKSIYAIYQEAFTIRKTEKLLDSICIATYGSANKNLLWIGSPNEVKEEKSTVNILEEPYYPILHIEFSNFDSSGRYIYNNMNEQPTIINKLTYFSAYILESKEIENGEIIEQSTHLPKEWIHGYSKGVYLIRNQNITIYWVVEW